MNLGGTRRQLLLVGAAAIVLGAAACSPTPVIPRDPCRTIPDNSPESGPVTEDPALDISGPIRLPVEPGTTAFTSHFGERWGTQHQGVDLAGPVGTKILAALDGRVVASGPASGFGNWIVIDSNVEGKPVSTVYGHMFAGGLRVQAGQMVKAGDHIADIGNAGQSTGAHLHFEYWDGGRMQGGTAIDPQTVLPNIARDNGNGGAAPDSDTIQLVAATRSAADCAGFGMAGGGALALGIVPAEFEPWLRRAGGVCPQIDSPLLAAQLEQENGFRHGANAPVSPSGALGPAQFMPGTWATWGKDYDGDGKADPNAIGDAVMSQAHFMCALYQEVSSIEGDPIELALAAYNAGPGAVQLHRGIPPYAETQNYVAPTRSPTSVLDGLSRSSQTRGPGEKRKELRALRLSRTSPSSPCAGPRGKIGTAAATVRPVPHPMKPSNRPQGRDSVQIEMQPQSFVERGKRARRQLPDRVTVETTHRNRTNLLRLSLRLTWHTRFVRFDENLKREHMCRVTRQRHHSDHPPTEPLRRRIGAIVTDHNGGSTFGRFTPLRRIKINPVHMTPADHSPSAAVTSQSSSTPPSTKAAA